jgi:hypothetical protein
MSFVPQAACPYDQESDLFGQGFVDPCNNDFFEQYLTFESIDNDNASYPVLPAPTLTVKSNGAGTQSAGTSSASRDEGSSHINLQEPPNKSWDLTQKQSSPRLLSSTECDPFSSEDKGRAASPDRDTLTLERISLERIRLQSPTLTPLSPSLPSSPKSSVVELVEASARRKSRFLDSVSKTLNIPKIRRGVGLPEGQHRSPIRKLTQGLDTHHLNHVRSPSRKVTTGAEVHFSSPTRSPIRKSTSPAKMMRSSQYSEQNLQEWSARLASEASKFDFGFQNSSGPLSPPPSARVSDSSDSSNTMMATSNSTHSQFSWDQPAQQYATRGPTDLHTPLTTPTTGTHGFTHEQGSSGQDASNMMYPGTPQHTHQQRHVSTSWAAPQLGSDFHQYSAPPSAFVQESDIYSSEPGPDAPPIWWGNASAAPMSHPSPASFPRASQQDTKSLALQLQTELAFNANELALSPSNMPQGLMIQLPHSPVHQSFVVSSTPMTSTQAQSYFPAPPSHSHPQGRRYTSAHIIPPPDPNSPHMYNQQTMRKSRSRGDIHESPSPRSGSRTPSFSIQKRRSASQIRHVSRKNSEHHLGGIGGGATPKTPKGGRTPKMGSGFVDFVNFTPQDSTKILTGVAPSGSSKTKARREKEAMEKRRRLSQAAMRAVQAAGGSIEGLVEEGLFV